MATPTETMQAVRAAALVNVAALNSVSDEVAAALLEVELWPNSASKGTMRDQLHRLRACYGKAANCASAAAGMATRLIDLIDDDPGPDPIPGPTTWSTGDW